ncbi:MULTISPECIES: SAF domain-containing protein [Cellulomonas]|uniref:SAF domain-containing protein n=1 Tax=Cellulomonas TaxID=1707 RepID=UPI001E53F57A|nr:MULTISPECIES: SAF domain-containing protein [Cellulomonas]MCR6705700.1 SAF domain-containing protein [Cellulomonas sp.]
MRGWVDGGVPPLERRRRPVKVAWRGVLWRWRFVVAALGVGIAVSSALQVLRPPEPQTQAVVVAARDLPAGTTIAATDVRVARVPAGLALTRTTTSTHEVVGEDVAVPVPAGLPVVPGLLASGGLVGPPGTVVAAVRLADPAMAALLRPGTRIDVLAAAAETGTQGVVVARHALVLPVPPGAQDQGWSAGLAGGDSAPVLVAVSPDEAAALSGAAVSALLSAVVVP